MKDNEKKIYFHFVGVFEMEWNDAINKINEEKQRMLNIPHTENELHFIIPSNEPENHTELVYKPNKENLKKQGMAITLYTGKFAHKDRYLYLAMAYDVYKTDDSIEVYIDGTESVSSVEFFDYV